MCKFIPPIYRQVRLLFVFGPCRYLNKKVLEKFAQYCKYSTQFNQFSNAYILRILLQLQLIYRIKNSSSKTQSIKKHFIKNTIRQKSIH